MVIDVIRELNHATPFRPYEVRMTSGERYRVPHPDFVFVSPMGSYVIIVDANEGPHHLDTFLIEEAVPLHRRRRRNSGKSRSRR